MANYPSRAVHRLSLLLVGIMILAVLPPAKAGAQTDLTLGGAATVSGTEGGFALLRTEPYWDALVLTEVQEGTTVDVVDGPTYDTDGTAWYAVVALDQNGYLPAIYLTDGAGPDQAATEPSAEEPAVTEEPTAEEVPPRDYR